MNGEIRRIYFATQYLHPPPRVRCAAQHLQFYRATDRSLKTTIDFILHSELYIRSRKFLLLKPKSSSVFAYSVSTKTCLSAFLIYVFLPLHFNLVRRVLLSVHYGPYGTTLRLGMGYEVPIGLISWSYAGETHVTGRGTRGTFKIFYVLTTVLQRHLSTKLWRLLCSCTRNH